MDWIEKLTGLEVDGGSGAVEWLIVLIPLVALSALALAIWRKRSQ